MYIGFFYWIKKLGYCFNFPFWATNINYHLLPEGRAGTARGCFGPGPGCHANPRVCVENAKTHQKVAGLARVAFEIRPEVCKVYGVRCRVSRPHQKAGPALHEATSDRGRDVTQIPGCVSKFRKQKRKLLGWPVWPSRSVPNYSRGTTRPSRGISRKCKNAWICAHHGQPAWSGCH